MKKIAFCLSILSLVFIMSCGSDDSAPVLGLSGTVTFDGNSYPVENGVFTLVEDDGNAIGNFFISDGELTSTSTGATATNASIIISFAAIHIGSTVIGDGAYATNSATQDQYVSNVRVTVIDGQDQTDSDSVTGGTVNISGSVNTYTITFVDVPFGQGVTLTGTVTGTYSN